jgi:2-iminobutanoate/2-iminopropanoate deaminase
MSLKKETIHTDSAPKAIGPYSQAVRAGDFIYTAGQGGTDPQTGEIVQGGIESETRQVLENIKNILEAAGTSLGNVVKTTVYLRDINDFAAMNAVYGTYFPANPPARSTIQAAALPRGIAVEIDTIAIATQ